MYEVNIYQNGLGIDNKLSALRVFKKGPDCAVGV